MESLICAGENALRQVVRHERNVPLSRAARAVEIRKQAPAAVGEFDGGRRFVHALRLRAHRIIEAFHALEFSIHMVADEQQQVVRVRAAFHKKVEFSLLFIHRGVNDAAVRLAVNQFRFAVMDTFTTFEIPSSILMVNAKLYAVQADGKRILL